MRDDVLVIGAGVIGLTTAICLAESGLKVRVVTTRPPKDTTSAAAGAMWGPAFAEPAERVLAWSRCSLTEFTGLARDPDTGVHLVRGRMASRFPLALDGELPPQVTMVPELVDCTPDQLPAGFVSGQWGRVPLVDMPRYLAYLANRLVNAGGLVDISHVTRLADVADKAPVIVNSSGVGARKLVPDLTVRAVRGQAVVVANPGIDEYFVEITGEPETVNYFPHGDVVVLGGVTAEGDWRTEHDPAVAEGILARCAEIEPLLADARVVDHRVGLRPERVPIRLDVTEHGSTRFVHCYGHGGLGVTLSWGCAREAASLAIHGNPSDS